MFLTRIGFTIWKTKIYREKKTRIPLLTSSIVIPSLVSTGVRSTSSVALSTAISCIRNISCRSTVIRSANRSSAAQIYIIRSDATAIWSTSSSLESITVVTISATTVRRSTSSTGSALLSAPAQRWPTLLHSTRFDANRLTHEIRIIETLNRLLGHFRTLHVHESTSIHNIAFRHHTEILKQTPQLLGFGARRQTADKYFGVLPRNKIIIV